MKDTIKIDKGIPIPSRRNKYPLSQMEVGDSFLIKSGKLDAMKTRNRVASSITSYRRQGWNFTQRLVENGIRIWRIK